MLKLNGGGKWEKHASDTESSKLCQRSRDCIQLVLQLALRTAPHAPHRLLFQKDLKYSNILKQPLDAGALNAKIFLHYAAVFGNSHLQNCIKMNYFSLKHLCSSV